LLQYSFFFLKKSPNFDENFALWKKNSPHMDSDFSSIALF
jgi:hypothetical protein